MTEQGLDETAIALILLHESLVLVAQAVGLLNLDSNLAFQLTDVFCKLSQYLRYYNGVVWSFVSKLTLSS